MNDFLNVFADFVNKAIDYIRDNEDSLTDEQKEHIRLAKENNLEPNFDEYEPEGEEATFNDFYYFFLRTVYVAIYVTEEKKFYEAIFKKDAKFTPWGFLNASYFLKNTTLCLNEPTQKLQKLYYNVACNVSLQRFVNLVSDELSPWMMKISEYEYYDILSRLTRRDASTLIELLDSSREIKNNLKSLLFDKNEEGFCNLCISTSTDFTKSAGIASIWYHSIINFTEKLSIIPGVTSEKEITGPDHLSILEGTYNDRLLSVDNQLQEALIDLQKLSEVESDISLQDFSSMNFCNICKIMELSEGYMVLFSSILEIISLDMKAVRGLKEHIQSTPYYKMLLNNLTVDNYEVFNYRCYEPIDNFRNFFVEQRSLPAQTHNKEEKEFILSNKTYGADVCANIYKELVKENILDASDDIFYSFVYRTAILYAGEAEPSVITWKGTPRELYYFVFSFSDGADTRLWTKTAKFFVFLDGSTPKTNGVKNQAQSSTTRMEALVKRVMK
jgi:hypothetical protein